MLPFLTKKEASVSAAPDTLKRASDNTDPLSALEIVVREMFNAKNDKDRARAFQAAFEILELQPHEEGPHNG